VGRREEVSVAALTRPAAPPPLAAAAPEPAIEVRGVAKTWDGASGVRALESVDFTVPRGQFVSVLGPSGCGKSTLLRIVAGLIECDTGGEVAIHGKRQPGVSPDVGVVFQAHNMLPWLTVEQNLRLGGEVQRMPGDELTARVEAMLRVLKLDAFRRHYPHQLSGGMRQRAGLGQTLVLRPSILLLDEPFGALDALTRDQLNLELLRLWEEEHRTVMLITHSIPEAVFLSDRVLVMSNRPASIVEDLAIDLPRPRDAQTKAHAAFGPYILHLNKLMGLE
jgi:NitT/TauT family transport system ATP-binding protein